MLIEFESITEIAIPHLNDGNGTIYAKMQMNNNNKIMLCKMPAGTSIGSHEHNASYEINYILHGTGMAICDGTQEVLTPGACHYCPKGSSHSICNTGTEDLILFTVVPNE